MSAESLIWFVMHLSDSRRGTLDTGGGFVHTGWATRIEGVNTERHGWHDEHRTRARAEPVRGERAGKRKYSRRNSERHAGAAAEQRDAVGVAQLGGDLQRGARHAADGGEGGGVGAGAEEAADDGGEVLAGVADD